jgi:hypothetical protein
MFLSIVGTQRYEIVTVKRWTARPAMPALATSSMIGRRLDAGRNPPAGFLRSPFRTGRCVSVSLCGRRARQPCRIGIDLELFEPKTTCPIIAVRERGALAEPGSAMWTEVDVTCRLQDGMCA